MGARTVLTLGLIGACLAGAFSEAGEDPALARARQQMVERQLRGRDIRDPAVLRAMGSVPRHRFVPPELVGEAYGDYPLPIGEGQTISQPYIVALMTQLLTLAGTERVLEVGTGSGYQAAVLAAIVPRVFSVEILPGLADSAARRLDRLGVRNVRVRCGDGYQGWPEEAPFDAVIVTAGASHIPQPLVDQLRESGRLVIPVGARAGSQELLVGRKTGGKLVTRSVVPVRFVPLVEPTRP
jgi:protein-L-isoaspartate(D-aspartate) O-methyltransferase